MRKKKKRKKKKKKKEKRMKKRKKKRQKKKEKKVRKASVPKPVTPATGYQAPAPACCDGWWMDGRVRHFGGLKNILFENFSKTTHFYLIVKKKLLATLD